MHFMIARRQVSTYSDWSNTHLSMARSRPDMSARIAAHGGDLLAIHDAKSAKADGAVDQHSKKEKPVRQSMGISATKTQACETTSNMFDSILH
jgi:hypothetical protein